MDATPEHDEELPLIEGWISTNIQPKHVPKHPHRKRVGHKKKRKEPFGFRKREEKSDA